MQLASRAEFLQLQPAGIIATILLSGVIALTAIGALKCDNRPIGLALFGHCSFLHLAVSRPSRLGARGHKHSRAHVVLNSTVRVYYSVIEVTTPAPTVRPPSRMAKRNPSSMATGVISSTPIWILSPGITISTPSGSSIEPVTSVVRM